MIHLRHTENGVIAVHETRVIVIKDSKHPRRAEVLNGLAMVGTWVPAHNQGCAVMPGYIEVEYSDQAWDDLLEISE